MDARVTVCVIAYNHAPYIGRCLDSILAQRTSFDFEVLVRDDASTDGTRDVLEEYARQHPSRVRLILEPTNTWHDPAFHPMLGRVFAPRSDARYLAVCEGDDFWTDETKLQRQFDYMEANPACLLCAHAVDIVREDGSPTSRKLSFGDGDRDVACGEIMRDWARSQSFGASSIHPSSCFSRRTVDLDYVRQWSIEATAGDYVRACYFAHRAPIHFMARPMSAYRCLSAQSWSSMGEGDPAILAEHYREFIEATFEIDELTGYAYHDAAMVGCKERALLLAGMTDGALFFRNGAGSDIKPYMGPQDWATLAAIRFFGFLGFRPARDLAEGKVRLERITPRRHNHVSDAG